jgi:hypothetical protein
MAYSLDLSRLKSLAVIRIPRTNSLVKSQFQCSFKTAMMRSTTLKSVEAECHGQKN